MASRRAGWPGWTAPLLAAAVVAGGILGLTALMTGGSNTGVGPDEDRTVLDLSVPARTLPPPVPLAPALASVVGYQAQDRVLVISYRVSLRHCVRMVVEPEVQESADRVTVTLRRVPGQDRQPLTCSEGPYVDSVAVPLRRPVGGREVRDAGTGQVVPVRGTPG